MAAFWLAIVLLLSSLGRGLCADEPRMRELRITDAMGQVTVNTVENHKAAIPVTEDTPLVPGDVVVTGPKSRAELTLDGQSVFKLKADSRLTILKLYVRNTQFEVGQGAILAKVKPATRPDQGFILKLPTAVVAIRGTEFAAESYNGVTNVGVFDEGHVVVAGAWGHEHVKLAPNQETRITLSNVPQLPHSLLHFKAHRPQMAELRRRASYWRRNWKPMSVARRRYVRQRLVAQHKGPTRGFQHPVQPPVIHRAVPHPAARKNRINHQTARVHSGTAAKQSPNRSKKLPRKHPTN